MCSLTILVAFMLLTVGHLTQVNASRGYCLQTEDAQELAIKYGSLTSRFSGKVAVDILAPDFHLYSTSAQALAARCHYKPPPPTSPMAPTFSSRADFIRAQDYIVPWWYEPLNLWHSCDTVTVRYQLHMTTTVGAKSENIIGMTTMRTTPAPTYHSYSHWIQSVYNEYDLSLYEATLPPCGHNKTYAPIPPGRNPPTV